MIIKKELHISNNHLLRFQNEMTNPEEGAAKESVYSEIEYRPYLEILPAEDHVQNCWVGETLCVCTLDYKYNLNTLCEKICF